MQHSRDIVVVGASAGGVQALQRLVAALPGDFAAAMFIVLHISPGSQNYLPAILSRRGPLPVAEAVDGAPVEPGRIVVAPADMHLMIERDRVVVVRGPRENRARPAVNPLFRSAAMAYRERVIGVILTGTLDDGSAGLWAVKQCGGMAVVQSDPEFSEMPRNAVENVQVDFHVPLDEMPALLRRLTQDVVTIRTETSAPRLMQLNDEASKMKTSTFVLDEVAPRSIFTCPECNGALWEIDSGGLHYRCHVGHAYSAHTLRQEKDESIEQPLWSALRALKESAALDERLANRARQHQLDKAEFLHRQSASEKREHVVRLQTFIRQLHPPK